MPMIAFTSQNSSFTMASVIMLAVGLVASAPSVGAFSVVPALPRVNFASPSRAFASSRGSSAAAVKTKPRKRRAKAGKRKTQNRDANLSPVSGQDLAEHVSELYLYGPRGTLHKSNAGFSRRGTLPSTPVKKDEKSMLLQKEKQEQKSIEARLARHPALLLNADYQPLTMLPLSLWSWQDAVKAVFAGKVSVVDVYPDVTIRAANLEIPLPSVIALTEYVNPKRHLLQTPAFTKRNVFLRDEYRCQYCSNQFATRDLSIDHVVPRCQGGCLNWENAVTSCRTCNGRKGCLPVSQLNSVGMRLLRPPSVPSQFELASIAGRMMRRQRRRQQIHPTWEPYLGLAMDPETAAASQAESAEHSAKAIKD